MKICIPKLDLMPNLPHLTQILDEKAIFLFWCFLQESVRICKPVLKIIFKKIKRLKMAPNLRKKTPFFDVRKIAWFSISVRHHHS